MIVSIENMQFATTFSVENLVVTAILLERLTSAEFFISNFLFLVYLITLFFEGVLLYCAHMPVCLRGKVINRFNVPKLLNHRYTQRVCNSFTLSGNIVLNVLSIIGASLFVKIGGANYSY